MTQTSGNTNALMLTLQRAKDKHDPILFGVGERMFPLCCKTAFVIEALETSDIKFTYINVLSNTALEDGRLQMALPEFPLLFKNELMIAEEETVRRYFMEDNIAKLVA
jgi:glutaredoxin-related protein